MTPKLPDYDAQGIAAALGLEPHPEGGWYKETWRGTPGVVGERGSGTAILFMLAAGERSKWHRVDATELWLYHAGGPLRLFTAPTDDMADVSEHRLGPDVLDGDQVQHVVNAFEWQAAEAVGGWCLVSCVVVPAFEFSGFELAEDQSGIADQP